MQIVSDDLLTNYLVVHPNQMSALLILHGWGQSSGNWQTILDSLPKNITGIALDLPAFGDTQALPGHPGVSEYADFVKGFITKLKLENVSLLGHSFGGQVAIDFSLRFPKLISHLLLASPACVRQPNPGLKSRLAKLVKPLAKVLPGKVYQYLFQRIASESYLNSTPVQRNILTKILFQDYSGKLQSISVPTSIIWGDKDITIENKSKLLAENIPHSHLYVLYGADHCPHLSAPQKLTSLLSTLLVNHAYN